MKQVILLLMLFCAGCLPATQSEVQDLTGSVKLLMDGVDALQGTTQQLVDDGVLEAEKVNKISEEIDKVQKHTETIVAEVETAEDPIEAISKGWDASKPFNPYYGYGAAILAALKLFSDNKKKKEVENKYAAAKIGMDNYRNNNPAEAPKLFAAVGDARKAKGIT